MNIENTNRHPSKLKYGNAFCEIQVTAKNTTDIQMRNININELLKTTRFTSCTSTLGTLCKISSETIQGWNNQSLGWGVDLAEALKFRKGVYNGSGTIIFAVSGRAGEGQLARAHLVWISVILCLNLLPHGQMCLCSPFDGDHRF